MTDPTGPLTVASSHEPVGRQARVARPGLLQRTWDGETVVFNPLSGEIHLLNETAAEALQVLAVAPANGAELAALVAERLSLLPEPGLPEHMTRLLRELDELGLLEPVFL